MYIQIKNKITKYKIKNEIKKKTSYFKCNEVSVLIILVFVPQPPILEMVPQMLFCSYLIKGVT
jgi:hypothetical protein